VFKALTGLTPKGFVQAHRARQAREKVRAGASVTEAIYASGFDSNARFYASADHMLGMTPTAYRAGGTDTDIHFAIGQCSLGALLVAQSRRGVCAILLGEDPGALLRELQDRFPRANLIGADRDFERLVARVVGLIEAPAQALELPLDIRGTVFQLRVWQALREIPPGTTASYAQIAERIGAPRAVRAVAGACAANPLAVAIPCHRVVRSNGDLAGYRWGVERKRRLLQREGAALAAARA
jgi:AraC family transcriptional regulator of adaptative response/methylated-DNA-[protein]-cysteine methyltransferase